MTFTYGPRKLDLKVTGFYEDIPAISAPGFIMTQADIARIGVPQQDNVAFVMLDEGADWAAVDAGIDNVLAEMPLVTAKDKVEYAAEQRAQFDQLLVIVYALLGLAVVIAVLGIINTLGLSVIERTREFGMLRAIGLRRDQLRRMVTLEAVVIALLGAFLGTGLGLIFGVALQQALKDDGFTTMSIPWLQIVVTLVVAGLVGVIAAAVPRGGLAAADPRGDPHGVALGRVLGVGPSSRTGPEPSSGSDSGARRRCSGSLRRNREAGHGVGPVVCGTNPGKTDCLWH